MDLDEFRSVLESSGVDVWTLIDTAIVVAWLDDEAEMKRRRDKIVEKLYASSMANRCKNCDVDDVRPEIDAIIEKESSPELKPRGSPYTPQSINGDDELDPYGGLFDDDEQKRILEIKELLEDHTQSEHSLVDLLQSLADMDITFKALKETDIGRHVNRLRKHSSNDVKILVKHLVRKWKEIVDEWVRLNPPGEVASSNLMAYEDSPQQKVSQNGHQHQVPDFAYSPNPHNGSSGSDKNIYEAEKKPKVIPRKETHTKANQSPLASGSTPQSLQRQRDSTYDLASASKRLQANYKEAENAKKQRTIQVMDIHEIPKPKAKNSFFGKNRGGGSHGRHW